MLQRLVESDVGWIQYHILVCLIFREDKMAIRQAEGIKLSKLADKVAGVVRCSFMFADLMNMIPHFALSSKKKYSDKVDTAQIVDDMQHMMSTDLLTITRPQPHNEYILVARMHESVLNLVVSLNGDDAESKRVGFSNMDDITPYTVTREELLILIRVTSNFVKNPSKTIFFHAPTFCIRARVLWRS